jgi:hypothetical protein
MSLELLDEQLACTLVSRFLNHLEAADSSTSALDKPADLEDVIVMNLLAVGKFLAERQIRWGRKKSEDIFEVEAVEVEAVKVEAFKVEAVEVETVEVDKSETPQTESIKQPLAVIVLADKIGKIGRKAKSTAVISAALKLHAALLLSNCLPREMAEAVEPVLRLCDHVQTAIVGLSQVNSESWKSCLELAKSLSDRLCEFVGDEAFVALKVKVAKKVAAGRKDRKLALKIEAVRDPERASQRKNTENRRKRETKKSKKLEHGKRTFKSRK